MIQAGKLIIKDQAPEDGVKGSFLNGVATLYADQIAKGDGMSVLLHEVGAHMGMKNLIGEEGYKDLAQRIKNLAASGDKIAQKALAMIPKEDIARGEDVINDEAIGYFVEELAKLDAQGKIPAQSALGKAWTKIKVYVANGLNKLFRTNTFQPFTITHQEISALNHREILDLAKQAVVNEGKSLNADHASPILLSKEEGQSLVNQTLEQDKKDGFWSIIRGQGVRSANNGAIDNSDSARNERGSQFSDGSDVSGLDGSQERDNAIEKSANEGGVPELHSPYSISWSSKTDGLGKFKKADDSATVISSQGKAGEEVLSWSESLPGIDSNGYITKGTWRDGNFHFFIVPQYLMDGMSSKQMANSSMLRDRSVMMINLTKNENGGYNLGISSAKLNSPMYRELEEKGLIKNTGIIGSQTNEEYSQYQMGSTYTKAFLSEAVRRMSMGLGHAPSSISFIRETGANPNRNVKSYGSDSIEQRFSKANDDVRYSKRAPADLQSILDFKPAKDTAFGSMHNTAKGVLNDVKNKDFSKYSSKARAIRIV